MKLMLRYTKRLVVVFRSKKNILSDPFSGEGGPCVVKYIFTDFSILARKAWLSQWCVVSLNIFVPILSLTF